MSKGEDSRSGMVNILADDWLVTVGQDLTVNGHVIQDKTDAFYGHPMK